MFFILSLLTLLPTSFAQTETPTQPIESTPPVATQSNEPTHAAVLKITSPEQFPKAAAERLGIKENDINSISETYPWYVSVTLLNDNSILNPDHNNDYALTGRTSITIGKRTSDGYEFGVYGYSAAYTERYYHYQDKTTGADYFVPFVGYKETKGPTGSKLIKVANEQDQEFNSNSIIALFFNNYSQQKWYIF